MVMHGILRARQPGVYHEPQHFDQRLIFNQENDLLSVVQPIPVPDI